MFTVFLGSSCYKTLSGEVLYKHWNSKLLNKLGSWFITKHDIVVSISNSYLHLLSVQVPNCNIIVGWLRNILLDLTASCEVNWFRTALISAKEEIKLSVMNLTLDYIPRQCCIRIWWVLYPLNQAFTTYKFGQTEIPQKEK